MSITAFKMYIPNEVLTASDLNSSFSQIIDNARDLISPLTASLDMNGNELIMDADADSSLTVDTDDVLHMRLQGLDAFIFDGDVSSPVNGLTFTSSATGVSPSITAQGSDTNIGVSIVPKGTGSILLDAASTGSVDIDGAPLVLDADGDSSIRESADDVLTVKLQNVDVFIFDGDVASPVNGLTFKSSATGVAPSIEAQGSDSNIDLNLVSKSSGFVTVEGVRHFDPTHAQTTSAQNISAATNTDLTTLTALNLPNTSATLTSRSFIAEFVVGFQETSGATNLVEVRAYNGSNGTKADTVVGVFATVTGANSVGDQVVGRVKFTPGATDRTKLGLAVTTTGTIQIAGVLGLMSSITIAEVP